jgi:uncharacterized protein YfaP (DUF2135 family)
MIAVALTLSPSASAKLYWANTSGTDGIGRVDLDGTTNLDTSFIATANPPRGVAIDASFIYWTQGASPGAIGRGNLDGTGTPNQTFITTGDSPQGVALDSTRVYWTNTVSDQGKVGRAFQSGASPNSSLITTAGPPCGIALDGDDIRWANGAPSNTISDGHGPFEVNPNFITGQADPCGVAVTNNFVYWTNRAGGTIGRANLDGSGVNASFVNTGMGSSPCGVAVDGAHIYWTDPVSDKIGRVELDGTTDLNASFVNAGTGNDPCGLAVSPSVEASPSTFAFTETAPGAQSDIQAFVAQNTSSSILDVSAASFVGPDAGDFEMTGDSCSIALTPAGGSCLFNVRFTPTAEGTRNATLRIATNSDASPTDIALSGVGVPAPAPSPEPFAADTEPPATTIAAGPPSKTKKKQATVEFSSSEPDSSFECRLDEQAFAPCTSPQTFNVGKGKHTFEVRATDAAQNTDPTPATLSWTVKKKSKHRK